MSTDLPKWRKEIDEILEQFKLPEQDSNEDKSEEEPSEEDEKSSLLSALKSLGFEVIDEKNLLRPDQVEKFMKLFNSKNSEGIPSIAYRYFFESLIRQFTIAYPARDAAILAFKAGQIYERYKEELEK